MRRRTHLGIVRMSFLLMGLGTVVTGLAGMQHFIQSTLFTPSQLSSCDSSWHQMFQEAQSTYNQGQYDKAYKMWGECLVLAQQQNAGNTGTAFEQINDLKMMAQMYKTQQKQAYAATAYERAIGIAVKAEGKNSALVSELMVDLARIYTYDDQIKSPAKASELLEEAFRINESMYGKMSIPTGDVAIALGALQQQQKQYLKAIVNYQLAVDIGNKLEPDSISCCRIGPRQQLANCLEKLGRYGDALKVHEELVSMAKKGAPTMLPTIQGAKEQCIRTMKAEPAAAHTANTAK